MIRSFCRATVLILAVTSLAACGTSSTETPAAPAGQPAASATQLPPGHPPTGGGSPGTLPPVPADAGTGSSALVWQVPATWEEVKPSSTMRRAQYRVPGAAGDGECVVFYFGPGQGGDAMANANRWAGMFTQPDGKSSLDVMKTRTINVGDMAVLMIEVTGTYNGGMGGGQAAPGSMLLGAVAEGADANWFFKLTGPQATIESQREAFEGMIQSLKKGA